MFVLSLCISLSRYILLYAIPTCLPPLQSLASFMCFQLIVIIIARVAPDLIFSNPAGAGFGIGDPPGPGMEQNVLELEA